MATDTHPRGDAGLHPVHVVLIASVFPLFLGGLLSDLAYGSTYEVQWQNFASWLIAGALLFTGLALLWSIVDLIRVGYRSRRSLLYALLVMATFIVGLVNALVHAKDAWAAMPESTILSVIVTALAVATIWAGFVKPRAGASQ